MSRLGAVLDWLTILCGPFILWLIAFDGLNSAVLKWLALMGAAMCMIDAMKDRAAARTTPHIPSIRVKAERRE